VTTAQRLGILAATVVVLILAFVLLRAGSGDSGSTAPSPSTGQPAVKTVRVVGGKPQGGVQTLSFVKGDRVRLRIVSDVADEIHVHGYDLKKDVEKGGNVEFSFPATIEGVFGVELENAGTQIANLEVRPS
jgi:FtsP/CotA-like multicopper oxidase with cupredoxin domain